MEEVLQTERLELRLLDKSDAEFIQELVNTPGWLKYIGDRHIHSKEDAEAYIARITNAPQITYWTAFLINGKPVGIVTLIKRDYLDSHDIGFAFLPTYSGSGYAFEATLRVMEYLKADGNFPTLYAITIPDNTKSINLLSKLGFLFVTELEQPNDRLSLFSCSLS